MSSASETEWCLIESDPGVFTELIKDLGCTGVEVEEIWSFDESLSDLKPVHGLIFLFKCDFETATEHMDTKATVIRAENSNLYFAKQVIHNACASLAIINLLMNVKHIDVCLGETLMNLESFSRSFNAFDRGNAIGSSDVIRTVHNSFSRSNFFQFDKSLSLEKEDSYHFIAYVPFDGHVYELDGMKEGPIDHGEFEGDWLTKATSVVQERMACYAGGEFRFTLLAVISERLRRYQKELGQLTCDIDQCVSEMDAANIARLTELVQEESERHQRYKVENIRRRHNYIPLVVELLKILSERGQLNSSLQAAVDRNASRRKTSSKS